MGTKTVPVAPAEPAAGDAGSTAAAQPAADETGRKARLTLLADRTAIAPGGSVELAIVFDIIDAWHTYWRNRGEGGLEPTFKWDLPPGFTAGAVRFPPPQRHIDKLGDHTFILEGRPVLLVEIQAPDALPTDQPVTLALDVEYLVCRELCVMEEQRLEVVLPVVADASAIQPAHEDEFESARDLLPMAMDRAPHVKSLRAAAGVDKAKGGQKFQVAVVLDLPENLHVNAHEPLDDALVATDVFADSTEGLFIGRPIFPPGQRKQGPLGEMLLYSGQTVILLPVEADAGLAGEQVRISGVVIYQACDDLTKKCFPPAAVEWTLSLPVAGADEDVHAVEPALFAGTTLPPATSTAPAGEPGAGQDLTAVSAPPADDSLSLLQRITRRLEAWGIAGILMLALVGGFVLNFMPCVLPVISIKILSFVQQAKEDRWRVFTLGLVFAIGILVSFAVLGLLIVLLEQQWGGLFQKPQVVIGLAAVVTAFAMSLFGVFAINPPRVVNELGEKVSREGHLNAFGMGLLATLLGTACSAPFLSAALATATRYSSGVGLMIFVAAGIGMAFPYVLLAAKPAWIKVIPRPGPWMATFEHVVGFTLLGTVVFLLNTLATQLGGRGLIWVLAYLLCVAIAAWLYGKVEFGAASARKVGYYGAALLFVVVGWVLCFSGERTIDKLIAGQREIRSGDSVPQPDGLDWSAGRIPWVPYEREKALAEVAVGRTIFIDYTADWCINCKANERLVLETPEVRTVMIELGVVPYKADYTLPNPQIKEDLKRFGRTGVPMYVIIPGGRPDEPILLDELLTKSAVIEGLRRAGPSRAAKP